MGYEMQQVGQNFRIHRERLDEVRSALKVLWARTDLMGGGDSDGRKWFMWYEDVAPESDTLDQWLRKTGWEPAFDRSGVMTALTFQREKIGDERHIFAAIAPFVEAGSWLAMEGEDGQSWRWTFDGERLVTR